MYAVIYSHLQMDFGCSEMEWYLSLTQENITHSYYYCCYCELWIVNREIDGWQRMFTIRNQQNQSKLIKL